MKSFLLPGILLACLLCSSCARDPILTEEILFYRDRALNQGNPCAVDIIYPYDQEQLEQVLEYGPEDWFSCQLYDRVRKDKAWLEADRWMTVVKLRNKIPEDPFMVIFAEFTHPDLSPPLGQRLLLRFQEEMEWPARRVEHIYVHDGSMERLEEAPQRSAK